MILSFWTGMSEQTFITRDGAVWSGYSLFAILSQTDGLGKQWDPDHFWWSCLIRVYTVCHSVHRQTVLANSETQIAPDGAVWSGCTLFAILFTDRRSWQTVRPRSLLMELSDQGVHCLPFCPQTDGLGKQWDPDRSWWSCLIRVYTVCHS